MKKNNFITRVLTAVVLGPVFLFAIYWNEWSYCAVFGIILIIGLTEFYNMFNTDLSRQDKIIGISLGITIYTFSFLYVKGVIAVKYFYVIPLFTLLNFIRVLYKKDKKNRFPTIGLLLVGVLYLALPFSLMHLGTFMHGEYNYELLLTTIFGVWASDTGGYIFGSLFGRNKLFERISQKKTWEGVIGGVLFAILTLYICSSKFVFLQNNLWLILGLIISISSVYGDLVESLLKRNMGLKDSGAIIPGHGGILDRFDSFLFAITCVVVFTKLYLQ